jgi:AcrR family transcriptional regulator
VGVARWDPDARQRLARAALELFAERGYDATTVAGISERAGLTKSTFFRHFDDKRDVLFAGQDAMVARLSDAASTLPDGMSTLARVEVLLGVLVDFFPPDQRGAVATRAAVISAHSELRERELLKREKLIEAFADGLGARGVDRVTARLAATIGLLALEAACTRWAAADDDTSLSDQVTVALNDLAARASHLGQGSLRTTTGSTEAGAGS